MQEDELMSAISLCLEMFPKSEFWVQFHKEPEEGCKHMGTLA